MNFTWRDCGYTNNNSKSGRSTDYDVYVSLTRSSRKLKEGCEWAIYDIGLTFRKDILKVIKKWDYTAAQISEILPNSEAIGIKFYTAKEAARNKKVRDITFPADGKSCVVRFPVLSKTEYDVLSGWWDKQKHDAYSDTASDCYYIKRGL